MPPMLWRDGEAGHRSAWPLFNQSRCFWCSRSGRRGGV